MNYTLTIQSEDYAFIKEAIKLRTHALLEELDMQVDAQIIQASTPTPAEAFGPCSFQSAPVKAEGQPVSFTVNVEKKPHWTQTPRGKKIMSARRKKIMESRKRKGQK